MPSFEKKKTKKGCEYSPIHSDGASDGNRTRVSTLARLRSTIELHLQ